MMLVTMQSIVDNNNGTHKVYVFTNGLNEESKRKIRQSMINWKCQEIIINVDDRCLDNVPILRKDFNKTPYYKLLIPEYISDEIDKLLYLDADIIVNRPLQELFDKNLEDYYFAAVPDYLRNENDDEYLRKLGIDKNKGERYFNSGLILFNMRVFKKKYSLEDALDYIKKNGHSFKYHDQEVLNGMYYRNYIQLSDKYNTFAAYSSVKDIFKYLMDKEYRNASDVYVIHYANARLKPWNDDYVGKYEKIYWQYAKKTLVYYEMKGKQRNKITKQIKTSCSRIYHKIKKIVSSNNFLFRRTQS